MSTQPDPAHSALRIVHFRQELVDFHLTLRRYRAYGEDAANLLLENRFHKVINLGGQPVLLTLRVDSAGIIMETRPGLAENRLQTAVQIARHLLGMAFPLPGFYEAVQDDPILRELCRRFYGLRPTLTPDPFEMLVTSITAQQINLPFAFKVRSRLIRRFGTCIIVEGHRYYAFPTPVQLARATVEELHALQLSRRKAETLIELARRAASGNLLLDDLDLLPDQAIEERFMEVRGIGRWTIDWLLARGLGRGHVFPAGDLGVRKAVQRFYFDGRPLSEPEIRAFAQRWGEFANLAAHYLLAGLTVP